MKITVAVLKKWGACEEGIERFGKKSMMLEKMILKLKEKKRYDWIWWTMRHTLDKTQSVKVAIYAAESVIDIFERKYPNDKRPRKAIKAAKAWLKNPCEQTAARAAEAEAATWADSTKADLIVDYYIKILREEKGGVI